MVKSIEQNKIMATFEKVRIIVQEKYLYLAYRVVDNFCENYGLVETEELVKETQKLATQVAGSFAKLLHVSKNDHVVVLKEKEAKAFTNRLISILNHKAKTSAEFKNLSFIASQIFSSITVIDNVSAKEALEITLSNLILEKGKRNGVDSKTSFDFDSHRVA